MAAQLYASATVHPAGSIRYPGAVTRGARLGLLAALVTAAPCSCARPIVYQLALQQPRSSSAIALVLASSGAGSERIDVTTVDDRGIRDYFGDVPVWIELPPGPHFFW